jgi:hypothetical protein
VSIDPRCRWAAGTIFRRHRASPSGSCGGETRADRRAHRSQAGLVVMLKLVIHFDQEVE